MNLTILHECNKTVFYEKPPEQCIKNHMKLTQSNQLTVVVYSILFVFSSVFNLKIIYFLCCKKNVSNKSQMNRFMFHLTVADLMITFLTIPLEIGWKLTVYWKVGNWGCKFFQFLRPIGNYLASFIVISLCIDRY
jgi:gonadotropin-releasing hormone receptor